MKDKIAIQRLKWLGVRASKATKHTRLSDDELKVVDEFSKDNDTTRVTGRDWLDGGES
jgi:hypothetical protein